MENEQGKTVENKPVAAQAPVAEKPKDKETFPDKKGKYSRDRDSRRSSGPADGFEEIVIKINRCAKVVKGGKRFSFAALVAVGDRHTHVGFGKGKAKEVPFAVQKAVKDARKNLVPIPMKDTTIPHTVTAKYSASTVIIRPACRGTGIIAGSAVRAVLELAGIKDVLAKVLGSTNPTNVVKATMQALKELKSLKDRKELLFGTGRNEIHPVGVVTTQAKV